MSSCSLCHPECNGQCAGRCRSRSTSCACVAACESSMCEKHTIMSLVHAVFNSQCGIDSYSILYKHICMQDGSVTCAHNVVQRGHTMCESHASVLGTQPRYVVLQTCLSCSKNCIADLQKSAQLTEQGDPYSDRHQIALYHGYSKHHVLARLAHIPRSTVSNSWQCAM